MYYFIDILYLISAVTSMTLKIDKDIEFNNTRRSEKQDPSKWYPIQSYKREATAFYDKEDVSDSDSNSNKAINTPTRTSQRKQKREEGRFSKLQNTKYMKGRTTHNKIKDGNGRKHHRQKHINRQSNLLHTKTLKTLKKRVQNEKDYYKSRQINPYINNSFKKSDTKTHSSHFKQHYRTHLDNRLWPEELNLTVFDDRLKLPSNNRETHNVYLQEHNRNYSYNYKNILNKKINDSQLGDDNNMSFKKAVDSKTKNVQQPTHDSSPNKVLSSSRNESHPQSLSVIRHGNHSDNLNTDFGMSDRTLYLNKEFIPKLNVRYEHSTPFIRNIKGTKSAVNDNTHNTDNLSHEVQRIWQQELQQQIKNKTEEKFNKKNNEDVEKQLSHNLKNPPADFANIINGTVSLWQPWVHRVKDDAKINSFINRTLHHNLGLFRTVEQKTTDKRWKKILKELAATYEEKFKEFIKDTKHHKVKSKMGTERVILNCIEVSNRIIKRLLNYELDDMDKKGFLRNSRTLNVIAKELQEKTESELKRACLKLGICRSHNGFTEFVIDFLTMTLSLDVHKFERAYSSLISAVKSTNFSHTLGQNSDKTLKKYVTEYEHVDLMHKKSVIMIIKNIIMKRNSPLIIYGDSNVGQVNKTIALLEIVNILDKNVPNSHENYIEWINIKTNLDNFAKDRESNIQSTMLDFVAHIKNVIDRVNAKSWVHITHDSQIVLT